MFSVIYDRQYSRVGEAFVLQKTFRWVGRCTLLIGATVRSLVQISSIDPLRFMGGDPDAKTFCWVVRNATQDLFIRFHQFCKNIPLSWDSCRSWFTASKLARGDFFSKLRVSLVLAEMVSSLGSTLWWGVQGSKGPQKKVEILKIKISFLFSLAASYLDFLKFSVV